MFSELDQLDVFLSFYAICLLFFSEFLLSVFQKLINLCPTAFRLVKANLTGVIPFFYLDQSKKIQIKTKQSRLKLYKIHRPVNLMNPNLVPALHLKTVTNQKRKMMVSLIDPIQILLIQKIGRRKAHTKTDMPKDAIKIQRRMNYRL